MKKILIIFLACIGLFTIKAQVADEVYTFQSPEAASLGFVSSIPVDLYVGRASVSIPLFNVEHFKYPVSVSLSYNSDGFMPNVQNNWVGQNWSLQAGGVITRVVKGLPDETHTYGLFHSYPQFISRDAAFYATGHADTEPDEFHFSVNGISGVFYLNEDLEFVVVSEPGIKVEYSKNEMKSIQSFNTGKFTEKTFSYFIITDQAGNRYYFGNFQERDNKYIELSTSPEQRYCTATTWNLNFIVLRKDDQQIKYTYSEIVMDINVSKTEKIIRDPTLNGPYDPIPCKHNPDFPIITVNYIEHFYLKTIECGYLPGELNWKIDFYTSDVRYRESPAEKYYTTLKLSPFWQKLDSITLTGGMSDEVIKSVKFEYKEKSPIRLFLSSVKESGKPAYEFEYYNYQTAKSIKFDSEEVDHWGFYNGYAKRTGSSYSQIPQELPQEYATSGFRYFPHRETNPDVVTIGMLSSIKHPTGAVTEFIYEPNTYSLFEHYDTYSHAVYPMEVTKCWSDFKGKIFYIYPDSCMYHGHSSKITFENPAYVILNINAPYSTGHDKRIVRLFEAGDHELVSFLVADILDNGWPANTMYSFSLMYKEITSSQNAYAGGVRIKEIRQKEKESEIIKEYNYTTNYIEFPTNTKSTGILGSYPYYGCKFSSELLPPFYVTLQVQKSTTRNAQEYTKGRQIGYSTVTEIQKNNTGDILGYIQYRYTNFDRYPDAPPYAKYQVSLHDDFDVKTRRDFSRGKLLSEFIYDKEKRLVKSSVYTYKEHMREPQLEGASMSSIAADLLPCENTMNYYNIIEYGIENSTFLPESKIITEYFENGSISTTTEYKYNNYDLIEEETIYANDVIKESYTYPINYTTQPFQDMVRKNILTSVVEKTTKKNNRIINSIKTDYYGSEHLFLPKKIQQSKDGINYSDIRTYDSYDYDGNVLQYTNRDNIPTILIWSYFYQYPVFEIKNITLEDLKRIIGTALFEEMYNPIYITDSRIHEIGQQLRTKLGIKPQVSSYTYKPFVGLTSQTDPRGVTTYYEYDDSGRLKETYIIENNKKKILQVYDYNYRNN